MTDRYENIRKALEMGPTPGEWYWSDAYPTQDGRKTWSLIGDGGFGILSCDGEENSPQSVNTATAEFIAACDPDTIRALLDERDALREKTPSPPFLTSKEPDMDTKDNDRELLELAAKAGGYELDYAIRPDGKAFYRSDTKALALADGGWFAPLTDDGDALRLVVKLAATSVVKISHTADSVIVSINGVARSVRSYCGDPCAATRRAIVQAAAEIGRVAGGPSRSDDGDNLARAWPGSRNF